MKKFNYSNPLSIGMVFVALFFGFNTLAQTPDRDPILIIPGIGASWNTDVMLGDGNAGNWDFFPGVHQYDQLIQAFEDAGLERDRDFYVVFYDWRGSNIDSAEDYLVPVIDKALSDNNADKVDIVAHSMGGLVARAYIQGDNYRNDVSDFITLGTPHYGSSDLYTLWEAGIVPDNWDRAQRGVLGSYLWYLITATGFSQDAYDAIHTFVPSIGEMMPQYSYLYDPNSYDEDRGDYLFSEIDDMYHQNSFLKLLNGFIDQNYGRVFRSRLDSFTSIAGTGEATVGNIPIDPYDSSHGKLWKDGIPNPETPERNTTEGDNRVLLSSTYFNFIPPILSQYKPTFFEKFLSLFTPNVVAQSSEATVEQIVIQNAGHAALPTIAIDDVFEILDLPDPDEYAVLPEPDNILSFWLASPLSLKIIDPNGNVISKEENTIPDAGYVAETDPLGVKIVVIPNAVKGQYRVELEGLATGSYHLGVNNVGETDEIKTVEGTVTQGQGIGYNVQYDPDASEPTENISEPFPINEPPVVITTIMEDIDALSVLIKNYYQANEIDRATYTKLNTKLLNVKVSAEAYLFGPKALQKETGKKVLERLEDFMKAVEEGEKKKYISKVAAKKILTKAEALEKRIEKERKI